MTYAPHRKPIALIVEDDLAQCELGAALLEELDLSVRQVQTAEDAIQHLRDRSGEVTVLVADVNLPGPMDGVSLARSVSVLWPGISVIVTSGAPGGRLGDLPPNCVYVPKPWRPLDIAAAAERAARADHSVHAVRL
ncbi:response regulator [Enterovirga aerilata]|uniref:Response regulator n=1 Tax=Enterovirga aerilata TaxID=2730920 RepID=A0A849HXA5_9HYPH|nr:response regulator [Enterovirga sp. DB1703]NNM72176.1 response regulator [Enterovirga sp. DB1703]